MTTVSSLPGSPSLAVPDGRPPVPPGRSSVPSGNSWQGTLLQCEDSHERVLWSKAWSRLCWVCGVRGRPGFAQWVNRAYAPVYREDAA